MDLAKHSSVFQGLRKLKEYAVKLTIDECIVPVAEPQRCSPFHIQEKVKIAIEKLLAD